MARNNNAGRATKDGYKQHTPLSQRGLGRDGGAWNLKQASRWCGIGENHLRTMAKNDEIDCVYRIGRRIIVPREGFKAWFNRRSAVTTIATE